MKAVVLKANQHMDFEDYPLTPLQAELCRVHVKNVGVCSSDIHRGCGNGAYFYPLIMGHELAGEIEAVGDKVKNFAPGDRVVVFPLLPCFHCDACAREMYAQCRDYSYYGSRCHGGYAEFIDVKAWNLIRLPAEVSFADAAAVEPLAVVLHALDKAAIKPASSIAILGSGFLGLLMAMVLKDSDCTVTVFDRNKFKLDIAKHYVQNVVQIEDEAAWKNYVGSKDAGFDVVVEASGTPSMYVNAIDIASPGGTVVWMSNIGGDLTLPQKYVSQALRKELSIKGTWNSIYRSGRDDDWGKALQFIGEGLKPSTLVTHWIELEEVPEILLKLYNHKNGQASFSLIKAMVTI